MRFHLLCTATALTLGLAFAACSTEPEAQTGAATEGALGFAPAIDFGQTVTGQVASPQLDLWAVNIKAGDQIRVTNTVTGGDLKPDIVLFQGRATNHVSSDEFDVNTNTLMKKYALEYDGTYIIVVRGYQNQGAGSYSLAIECLGGPCAGETPPPPVVELDEQQKHECIQKARECSVAKLPEYNGYVGAVRAQGVFDECLGATTVETWESDIPASCTPACQGEYAEDVCDAIVAMLPWLADQTPTCIGEFNSCIDYCYDAAWGDTDDSVEYGGEAVCVTGLAAMHRSCGDVSELEVCGGRWADDSCEACYIGCLSTSGAWIDDLDVICEETCECEPSEDFYY